jgi:ubiquinone/menaquinone biosynthesis C-methylase UbiE
LRSAPVTGINFEHYPQSVTELVAVEPEPYLRARAETAAQSAPVPTRVTKGTAAALELEAGSADVLVVSGVLCSVSDQAIALAEFHRVLRPGVSCASMSTSGRAGPRSPAGSGSSTVCGRG